MKLDINSLTDDELLLLHSKINNVLEKKKEQEELRKQKELERKNGIFYKCIKNNYVWVTSDYQKIPLYAITDKHWLNIKRRFKPDENSLSYKDYIECENYRNKMIPIKQKEYELRHKKNAIKRNEKKLRKLLLRNILYFNFRTYINDFDINTSIKLFINNIVEKYAKGNKYFIIDCEDFDLNCLKSKLKLYNTIKQLKNFNLKNYINQLYKDWYFITVKNFNNIDDFINHNLDIKLKEFENFVNCNYDYYYDELWERRKKEFYYTYNNLKENLNKRLIIIPDSKYIYDIESGTLLEEFNFLDFAFNYI